MADLPLTPEARELLEKFLQSFPSAIRATNRRKTLNSVEYVLLKQGLSQVAPETLFAAIEQAYPKSFEPIILRLKDPQKLKELAGSQKEVDEQHPCIRVRRWDLPATGNTLPVKKIFAFLAGPRKGGNTDCIMDALLEGASREGCAVEKLHYADLTISPCTGCMACEHKELETFCAVRDDMTGLYTKFLDCDAFVLGFPVYTARECAQAAAFFDRLKALRSPGHLNRLRKVRKGAVVATWGWPTEDAYDHVVENAITILNFFGVATEQVVTGSGFWSAYYTKGMAAQAPDGLARAREAGRALAAG